LLEGLEVSVLKLSEVLIDNTDIRIDSEYFRKEYLLNDIFFKNRLSEKIIKYANVSDGDHSKFPDNQAPEIRYLQAKDIKNHFLINENPVYVSKEYFNINKRSHIFEENVILSIMGSVGDIAITPKGYTPSLANRAIAIIKNIKGINPYYLFAYLSAKFGQLQIERQKNGGVQVRINLDVLSKVKIPVTTNLFQNAIESIVKQAHFIQAHSIIEYTKAETFLLQSIGLHDYRPSEEAVNIKSFKESYIISGRLDSEFYQKKYDKLESQLELFTRKRLGDFISYPVSSGITPKAGGDDYTDAVHGIPFIRAVDLKDGEVVTENFIYIKKEIHKGALKRTQLKKGDVLFSIAGTVGRCALFDHSFEANINQAVSILRFDNNIVNKLYLIVFFNSEIGKEFVSKYSRQGVQTNLTLTEVADLRIPIIDKSKQLAIANLVQESSRLKKQSEHLLEVAKKAVEMAIEEGEERAMEWIETVI